MKILCEMKLILDFHNVEQQLSEKLSFFSSIIYLVIKINQDIFYSFPKVAKAEIFVYLWTLIQTFEICFTGTTDKNVSRNTQTRFDGRNLQPQDQTGFCRQGQAGFRRQTQTFPGKAFPAFVNLQHPLNCLQTGI